nr:hypothetical protein [uncultured Gellertiella sp.]
MSSGERIRKYRETGGAADLVRVEVLVPRSGRDEIVRAAAKLRARHRAAKHQLQDFIDLARQLYGVRVFDNIDLDRTRDLADRARVVARALMERGDARAYAMGRTMISHLDGEQ